MNPQEMKSTVLHTLRQIMSQKQQLQEKQEVQSAVLHTLLQIMDQKKKVQEQHQLDYPQYHMTGDTNMNQQEIQSTISQMKYDLTKYKQTLQGKRQLDRPVSPDEPFVISFVGRFKTGKSSLLNALLGADILPTKATTATSVVTRIFRGEETQAWFLEKGRKQGVTLEEAKNIILNYHASDPDHPGEIILELPIPWLSHDVELRDTPGMDDSAQNGLLEKIAMNALEDTDLCVCVFDSSAMISAKERERTRNIHARMGGSVVYAINCTNRLNSAKQLKEVEDICDSFFGSLEAESSAVSGTGKYYLMCSAPKMIDLDGFDIWLSKIADSDEGIRSELRKLSAQGQLHTAAAEINAALCQHLELLQSCKEDATRQQKNIRSDAYRQAENLHSTKETRIRNALRNISDTLCNLSNLEDRLDSCTTKENWQDSYARNSKSKVSSFFHNNWKKAKNKSGEAFFQEIDGQFIKDTLSVVTFPGTSSISVSATSGERAGGAAIGAGIGALFGGPFGALVGGFIGQAIGGADTTTDNSVPNTMQFVRNRVVPSLRSNLESIVHKKLKDDRALARKNANALPTELDPLLADMNALKRDMNRLRKETETI